MQHLNQEDRDEPDLAEAVKPEHVREEQEPWHQDPVFVVLREENR